MRILNLRLLAGFTRRTENLWLSHLSSIAPGGTLASSWRVTCSLHEPEVHGQGHDGVAHRHQNGQSDGEGAADGVEPRMVDTEALEHRPSPVIEVKPKHHHGDHIEGGHGGAG